MFKDCVMLSVSGDAPPLCPARNRGRLLAEGLARHWLVAALILAYFSALIVVLALKVPVSGATGALVDFDAFHIVGRLALEGRLSEAYHAPALFRAYVELSGHEGFMPWTYPPMFDLVVAGLALLPRGVAFALFVGTSLALWVWVLWRLAGAWLPGVLLATAPVMAVMVASGQNGFLMAALAGLVAMGLTGAAGGRGAGLALGAMVMKPHLALGLGVVALAQGRWALVAWAAAAALALAGLATLAFGTAIWLAFQGGVAEAAALLRDGAYPLFRMTSVHAALLGLGLPVQLAMAVQIGVGGLVLGAVAWGAHARMPAHRLAALAVIAPVFISPYAYDYDLTLLGVALALVMADVMARARVWELATLLALIWVAGGWGLFHALRAQRDGAGLPAGLWEIPAIAVWVLLLATGWVGLILRRPQTGVPHRS
jgi:hypothetical protein